MKSPKNKNAPDVLVTGCAELLTLGGAVPRRGRSLGELGIIRDGALLVRAGRIAAIGPPATPLVSTAART